MGKYFVWLSIALLGFISCQSEVQCDEGPEISVNQTTLETQVNQIEAYLESEGIDYLTHPSGIRYSILESGIGNPPNFCSGPIIDYEGRVIGDDEAFISAIGAQFSLRSNQVAAGFKIALTLMNRNAEYRIYIPGELLINKGISSVLPANIPDGDNVEFRIRLNSY
jgi:FKBP-type peptidyl-prolyl cis-trans isomerase